MQSMLPLDHRLYKIQRIEIFLHCSSWCKVLEMKWRIPSGSTNYQMTTELDPIAQGIFKEFQFWWTITYNIVGFISIAICLIQTQPFAASSSVLLSGREAYIRLQIEPNIPFLDCYRPVSGLLENI